MLTSLRLAVLPFLFAFAGGCSGAVESKTPTHAGDVAPDGGSASSPSPSQGPGASGGSSASSTCGESIEAFCSANPNCPPTWAAAQAASKVWCTTPPPGVDVPTVSISSAPCGGYNFISVGEFGGPLYVYDAVTGAIVTAYDQSDTSGTRCVAGTPVDLGCPGFNLLCSYGSYLDAGADAGP